MLKQLNSFMAIDTTKDDRIVGIRINELQIRPHKLDKDPKRRNSACSIQGLLDIAKSQYDPWNNPDIQKILQLQFSLVDPEYRGQNLSIRMMESTFDLMRREKIPLAVVVVTGKFSRAVMDKLEFEVQFEMDYKDYKVNGERVFYPKEIHTGFAVLSKSVS